MNIRHIFLMVLAIAFCLSCIFTPSSYGSDEEILRRLELLEKEVETLKKENTRLRQELETDRKENIAEKETLIKKVEDNSKKADDIIRSQTESQTAAQAKSSTFLSKFDTRIYGRVKTEVNYDTAEFRKYNDWLAAVGVGNAGGDSTNFNPRDSRFGLEVSSQEGPWTSIALIETDFYGDNNGNSLIPRMRLGYVKLINRDLNANLLVGQDWIPVAQLNPEIFDFGIMAASGNLWWRVPQVTLRKEIGDIELLVSAMKHRRTDTAEKDRMPWMLGRVAYKPDFLGKNGFVAIGGGYKHESLVPNDYGIDNDVGRWLMALEFKMNVGKFTFAAEPWIGEGLEKEWLRYDMGVNTFDETDGYPNHRPELIAAMGGFVNVSYELSSKQIVSFGYGIDDPDNDDMKGMDLLAVSGMNDRRYTKNEIFFINSWYSITNAVKLGLELIHMDTERFGDSNVGTRYTFAAMYLF